MLPKIKNLLFLYSMILAASVCSIHAQRGGPPPAFTNERFVVLAMAHLHGAEATYQATTGAGGFGSLSQLRAAGLIDEVLAGGTKYGYVFAVTPSQATYTATAVPARYRKTGRYSYYIDEQGVVLGGDRLGKPTGPADGVYIDSCALWGLDDNERCTVQATRTLHGAEVTYAATVGNGQYGFLQQLHGAGLINWVLGSGSNHGYNFTIQFLSGPPATFEIWAVPREYGVTGRRSFYVNQTGVLRGADHGGQPAGPNDPPID
jgi:hypothetical protein